MRLFFPCLLGLYFAIASVHATNSTKKTSGAWNVLERCHLIQSPGNDGDSFKVAHQSKEFVIRLYYVDCPETYDTYKNRIHDQARYFSIAESDVIASGKMAKTFTKKFLEDGFTIITRWEDARGGREARYFGIVCKKDQLLSTELIRSGLARIYGMPVRDPSPKSFNPALYWEQLRRHERVAKQKGAGIWEIAQKRKMLK